MDPSILKRNFGVLRVKVKDIIKKRPKAPMNHQDMDQKKGSPEMNTYKNPASSDTEDVSMVTASEALRASMINDQNFTGETPTEAGLELTLEEPQPVKDEEHRDSLDSENSESDSDEDNQMSSTNQLVKTWKEMRNPPEGHVHNQFCPFWKPGDSDMKLPTCPEKTFTRFSGNPFTKDGAAYLEGYEARYKLNRRPRRPRDDPGY